MNILLQNEKYDEILNLDRKFNLIEKEALRKRKSDYIPNLSWSIHLAQYMEDRIDKERLIQEIKLTIKDVEVNFKNASFLQKTVNILSKNLPDLTKEFKSYLN